MTFKTFDTKNKATEIQQMYAVTYNYAKAYVEIVEQKSRQNSICLLGQPGTGKTHLLTALSNVLIAKGVQVQYFPWVEGFNDLKSDFEASDEKVNRLQRVPVLFIDDLFKGRDHPTNWQLEQLFSIVNYRYLNNLAMLISSEKTMKQMCDFDEGIGSRINEMCKGYKVTIQRDIKLNYRLQE